MSGSANIVDVDAGISVQCSMETSATKTNESVSSFTLYSASYSTPDTFKTPAKSLKQIPTPHSNMSEGQMDHDMGAVGAAAPHYPLLQQPVCSPNLHTPMGANSTRSVFGTAGSGATPTSLQFLTPSSCGLKGQHNIPSFYTTPGGTSKPILANPFDTHLLDRITADSSMFSPDMFKVVEPGSAEKTPKSFRWTIDEIAILKPADIEEMPVQQDTLNILPFPELESKVQKAIDQYFDKEYIVPSPWTESVKKFVLPRTPGSEPLQHPESRKSDAMDTSSKDVCCQTKITLPVDFDLAQALGTNFVFAGGDSKAAGGDCDSQGDVSTSSLRRKLFFHGDIGTPLSPVRSNKCRLAEVMDITSPVVSPLKCDTPPCQGKLSPMQTPSTGQFSSRQGQFSSSPISGSEGHVTPCLRRCSTAPGLMGSPEFSPISTKGYMSKDIMDSATGTPLCLPLQATPSSGRQSTHFASPGMSPITLKDGSYVTSPDIEKMSTKSDSLRRRAMRGQIEKLPVPRELQMSACDSPIKFEHEFIKNQTESKSDLIYYDENARDTDMMCDSNDNRSCERGDGFQARPEFTEFRENYEFDGENTLGFQALSTVQHSQDTGYQTCQSMTNHDTMGITQEIGGGASSNITSHFSCLPTSLSASEDVEHLNESGTRYSKHNFITGIMEKVVEDIGHGVNGNVPVSHYTNDSLTSSKSVDNITNKRPSSLIFSELQNLANKFPTTSSSTKLSYSQYSQSQEGYSSRKKMLKSFSTNDLRNPKKSLTSAIEQLSPTETDRIAMTEHSRKYTQGSMINHEQIYEPPIYVMTSNSQDIHSSQSDGARVSSLSSQSNRAMPSPFHRSLSENNKLTMPCVSSPISQNNDDKGYYFLVHTTKTPSKRECDWMNNNNYKNEVQDNNISCKTDSKQTEPLSYFTPARPKLYHGKPAHINPAFKIETLTPEEAPFSSQGRFHGSSNLAERLLSPDQHPPSPCPLEAGLRESEVRMRARRALGYIHEQPEIVDQDSHQMTEENRFEKKHGVSVCPWYQKGDPTQQKLQQFVNSMEKRKKDISNMLPSDMALQVLRKAEKDLIKLKNGEMLDPSFLDNTSFQDSCIIDDYPSDGEPAFDFAEPQHC